MSPGRRRRRVAFVAIVVVLLAGACTARTSGPSSSALGIATGGQTPSNIAPLQVSIRDAGYRLRAPVERSVAAYVGNDVYIAGGLDSSGSSVAGVFTLNPSTGKLTSVGSMASPFHDGAGAIIGSRLVVFGGGTANSIDTVQAYDLASRKSAVIGHMPVALSDLAAATIGDTTYLVGGYDGSKPRAEIYSTTDGKSFRTAGQLPEGLRYPAVTAVGSELIIAGGLAPSGMSDAVYAFDPAAGHVSTVGHLPTRTGHAAAFALGTTAYVAGGQDTAGNAVAAVEAIDPAAGTVTKESPLAQPLSDAAVAQERTEALIIGGARGGSPVSQVLAASLRGSDTPPSSPSPSKTADASAYPASAQAD
jgi:hypothetical protein